MNYSIIYMWWDIWFKNLYNNLAEKSLITCTWYICIVNDTFAYEKGLSLLARIIPNSLTKLEGINT